MSCKVWPKYQDDLRKRFQGTYLEMINKSKVLGKRMKSSKMLPSNSTLGTIKSNIVHQILGNQETADRAELVKNLPNQTVGQFTYRLTCLESHCTSIIYVAESWNMLLQSLTSAAEKSSACFHQFVPAKDTVLFGRY
ncbi:hypothetical protein TNCT_406941 [Trichonephila clavata]|uniref:Uncharacterized protein n=1 Tax=Trichonephila clavata TaxID=2740835 RepID=A0A8X6HDW8_TRICU|nr:hypothetical protein TNCT_406941 [Trichonephila clavata]